MPLEVIFSQNQTSLSILVAIATFVYKYKRCFYMVVLLFKEMAFMDLEKLVIQLMKYIIQKSCKLTTVDESKYGLHYCLLFRTCRSQCRIT